MDYQRVLEVCGDTLTDNQLAVLKIVIEQGGNISATAKELDKCRGSIRNSLDQAIKKAANLGYIPSAGLDHPTAPPLMITGDSSLYDRDGDRILHWIKTARDKEELLQQVQQTIHEIVADLPPVKPRTLKTLKGVDPKLHAIIPLGDPHIGMLSWGEETGQDWDLQLAEEAYADVWHRLVQSSDRCQELTICDLGDFWHSDNYENRTTRGGIKVDQDGRYGKMIKVGYRILMMMIDAALSHHSLVNVKILPGNHDEVGSIFLRTSLELIYRNEPRVKVDPSNSTFQYTKWGTSLVGYHHGHTCPMDQLPLVMANDQPRDWGECDHRQWYTGHVHKDQKMKYRGANEFQGCTVESFRVLSPNEAYAHEHGYRSAQDVKVIIHDLTDGEIARYRRSV